MGKAEITLNNGKRAVVEFEGQTPPSNEELQTYIDANPTVLTGGVEVNVPKDVAKSVLSEATAIPRALEKLVSPITNIGAQAVNKYGRPLIGKEPLQPEQVEQSLENVREQANYEPQTGWGQVAKFATALPIYMALFPELGWGSTAAAGATAGLTTATNEGGNPLTGGIQGLLAGLLTHGALKGGEKALKGTALGLSGIDKHIREAATQKGSKILDYFKFLEEGNPKIQTQTLWENIRKPFNLAQELEQKRLGENVGSAKQALFEQYKDINLPLATEPKEATAILNKAINDPQYKESILQGRLSNIMEEVQNGVTPERADELIGILDKDVINYGKELGDLGYFDKEIQRAASSLRQELSSQLTGLSPELAASKSKFSEFKRIQDALGGNLENIRDLTQREAAKAARQTSNIQQAVTGTNKATLSDLIKQLPLGEKTLQKAEQADLAQTLSKQQMKYEGVPIGWINAISRVVSGVPRKISIEKLLPDMLKQAEGTFEPNPINLSLQRLLEMQSAKEAGHIDAQQYRNRR